MTPHKAGLTGMRHQMDKKFDPRGHLIAGHCLPQAKRHSNGAIRMAFPWWQTMARELHGVSLAS